MLFFICVVASIIVGIVLGKIYNKLVIRHFSDKLRKLFCVLTMIIFICSAISVSVTLGIKSKINSAVSNYSGKIEQYIYTTYPDNEFLMNGLDLNRINNDISQINKTVSDLRTLVPSYVELKISKTIYDLVVTAPMEELIDKLSGIYNTASNYVDTYTAYVYNLADSNKVITVSSILSYLTGIAKKHINKFFLKITIALLIPFLIYVITTSTVILIVVKRRQQIVTSTPIP